MIPDKDKHVLSMLRKNARMNLTTLSKATNVPISTLHEKLKRAKAYGIKRFTALLDFPTLGYSTRVHIRLKVPKQEKEALKECLFAHPNINALYKINNGYDFLADAVFKTMNDAECFVEWLAEEYSAKPEVYYILDEMRTEGFLALPPKT